MSFNDRWEMPRQRTGRSRGSRGRFRANQSSSGSRRGRAWQDPQSPTYTSIQNWEQSSFMNYQQVQDPEYFSSRRRFRSPPSYKSPIYEDPPRPPSPLPGSEEYTQRNIQQTSELIKRQLNLEGQTEDFIGNEFQEPAFSHREDFMQDEEIDEKNVEKLSDLGPNVKKVNRFRNRNRSTESIDVNEIYDKIITHISKLSYNKKMNLVHQGSAGYDLAIQKIQKQQRLELSRALRDMSNKATQDSSDCEAINAIIPDIGIRIEDLPREVIAQLSSTLDIDFDLNLIDPEACFKQAEDLLDNQMGSQERVLDPFDFEYLNTPMEHKPDEDEACEKFEAGPKGDGIKDEFVLEINPNSSYLSGKTDESVNGIEGSEPKIPSLLKIRTDLVEERKEELISPNQPKRQKIKLDRTREVPATSNSSNLVKKDNSETPNLDLVLSQNLWLNNPEPQEESYNSQRNHSKNPEPKNKYIPPLIPPDQLPFSKSNPAKYIPPLIPPHQLPYNNKRDYPPRNQHFENDFTNFEDPRQFELEQIKIQQQLHHLNMKQQQLEEKRALFDPSVSSSIAHQQQFLLKEKLHSDFAPSHGEQKVSSNDFERDFPLRNNDYNFKVNEFHESTEDALHQLTIAERMYADMPRTHIGKSGSKRKRKRERAAIRAQRLENRRNKQNRSKSNEFLERRQRRSEEGYDRRNNLRRNTQSWSRSRSKDKRSHEREENCNNNLKNKHNKSQEETKSSSVENEKVFEETNSKQINENDKGKRLDDKPDIKHGEDKANEKKHGEDKGNEKKQTPVPENENKGCSNKTDSVEKNMEKTDCLEESGPEKCKEKSKSPNEVKLDENGKRKPFRIPKLSQKKTESTTNALEETHKEPPQKTHDETPNKKFKKNNDRNQTVEEKLNKLVDNEINKGKDSKASDIKTPKKEVKKNKEKKVDKVSPKGEEKEERKLRSRKVEKESKKDLKKSTETLNKDKLIEEEKVCEKETRKGRIKRSEDRDAKKSVEKELKEAKKIEEINEKDLRKSVGVSKKDGDKKENKNLSRETRMELRHRHREEEIKVEDIVPIIEEEKKIEEGNKQIDDLVKKEDEEQKLEEIAESADIQTKEISVELVGNSERIEDSLKEEKMEIEAKDSMSLIVGKESLLEEKEILVKEKEMLVEAKENLIGETENLVEEVDFTLESKAKLIEDASKIELKVEESIKMNSSTTLNSSNIVQKEQEIVLKKTWKSPGEKKLLPPHFPKNEESEESTHKIKPRAIYLEANEEQRNIFEQMDDFNTLMMNHSEKKNQEKLDMDDKKRIEEKIGEDNQSVVFGDEGRNGVEDGQNGCVKMEEIGGDNVVNNGKVGEDIEVKDEVNNGRKDVENGEKVDEEVSVQEESNRGNGGEESVELNKSEDKIEENVLENVPRRSKSGINRSKSNARPKSKQKGYLEAKIKELNATLNADLENDGSNTNKKRKRSTSNSSTKSKRTSKEESENESEVQVSHTPRTRRNSLRSHVQIESLPKTPSKLVQCGNSIETQTDPVYLVQEVPKEDKVKCRKTHFMNVVEKMKEIDNVIEKLTKIRQSLYEEFCLECEEEPLPTRKRSNSHQAVTEDSNEVNSTKHQKFSKKPKKKIRERSSIDDSISSVIQQFSEDPDQLPPPETLPTFLHPADVPQVNIPELPSKLSVRLIRYNIADLERIKDGLNRPVNQEPLVQLPSEESERQCEKVSEDVRTNVNIEYQGWIGSILVIKVLDNVVVAGNDKGTLYFYDLVAGDLKGQMALAQKPVTSICVSRSKEARTLYVGSLDGSLHVVDFDKHESLKSVQVEDPIQCMESSWGYIFIGSHKGNLIRYDIKKEKVEDSISISNTNVLVLRATQEGARKVLLVATRNYPIAVRDAMTGLLMRTMEGTLNPTVYTLLFHNSHVYCGTSQHDVLVYTFQDGQLMFKHEQSNTSGVVCMTIVKNLLFVGCYNGNIYVYNTNTNAFITSIAGPGGLFLSMEVAGNIIVAGTKQNHFKAWTLPDVVLSQIV